MAVRNRVYSLSQTTQEMFLGSSVALNYEKMVELRFPWTWRFAMSTTNESNKNEIKLKERYREFRVPVTHRDADSAHQLCVRADDGSKLYFISVYVYDKGIRWLAGRKIGHSGVGYQAECQFTDENGRAVDVVLHHDWKTIEEMEDFFEKMYRNMNFKPYDAE